MLREVPLLLVIVICGSLVIHVTNGAIITETPKNSYTLLGDTAIFNCSGQGAQLHWSYDGNDITDAVLNKRQITIVHHSVADGLSSTLYAIAKPLPTDDLTDANTIAISCIIVSINSNHKIEIASEGASSICETY